ncbi:MAG: Lrp/AsnC family transcriptional regulator [Pseudomonadota bacterium]
MKEQIIDQIDRSILNALQNDASLSQRELADKVGLSQNACWRRLRALQDKGIIKGHTIRVDPNAVDLGLTVFVMIRTRHHSRDWLGEFRSKVSSIPNVLDFYRIAGDYDYMLKIVAADMNAYDHVYQRLIDGIELDAVTSYITMEAICANRDLPV